MCTLHKAPSASTPSEHHRGVETAHPYLFAGVIFALVMMLKIGILLAFCYPPVNIKEASNEHYKQEKYHARRFAK
jgi:hypothetical protein